MTVSRRPKRATSAAVLGVFLTKPHLGISLAVVSVSVSVSIELEESKANPGIREPVQSSKDVSVPGIKGHCSLCSGE